MVHNQCLSILPWKNIIKMWCKDRLVNSEPNNIEYCCTIFIMKISFHMQFSVIQFTAKTMTVKIIYCIFRSICNVQIYPRLQLSHSFYIMVVTKMDRHSKCTCRKTQCPIVECIHDSNNIDIEMIFFFVLYLYTFCDCYNQIEVGNRIWGLLHMLIMRIKFKIYYLYTLYLLLHNFTHTKRNSPT